MTIASLNNNAANVPPSTLTPTGSNALGKDEFLKLMMAQLANQDPTAPADSQAFIAQLAQFSSVEQLQGANSRLDNLLLAQASASQTGAASLVGKNVKYTSDALTLNAGQATTLTGTLGGAAAKSTATIVDANGKVVRTMQLGPQAAGPVAGTWDGKDDGGSPLPPGTYHLRMAATDASGNAVTVTQQASGLVTGVSFANGVPSLIVAGNTVAMNTIIEIDQPH